MSKNMIIGIAVVVAIIVIAGSFFLFGKKTSKNINPLSKQPTPTTVQLHSAVSDVTVVATDFAFSPMTIPAVAGKKLTITVKNEGKMPHNLTFKELNVSTKTLQPGQSETITVTPPKAGMYRFICSVSDHEKKGMVGVLMIQPQGLAPSP